MCVCGCVWCSLAHRQSPAERFTELLVCMWQSVRRAVYASASLVQAELAMQSVWQRNIVSIWATVTNPLHCGTLVDGSVCRAVYELVSVADGTSDPCDTVLACWSRLIRISRFHCWGHHVASSHVSLHSYEPWNPLRAVTAVSSTHLSASK
uniref:Uncharacterized protein n=1 Tax=Lygus hesperus TaxID=30085 RepID=A0A0A9VNV7_LYGHE